MTLSVLLAHPTLQAVGSVSCYPGVGTIVPALIPGIGVAVAQASGDSVLANALVQGLAGRTSPTEVLQQVVASDDRREHRQLAVVCAQSGRTASFTGRSVLPEASTVSRDHCIVTGNLLASKSVVDAAAVGLGGAAGAFRPETLVECLRAGLKAGGDARGTISGSVSVSGRVDHLGHAFDVRQIDVRIDWSKQVGTALAHGLRQRLSYSLVEHLAYAPAQNRDVEALEMTAWHMAEAGPDASAAVLLCAKVIDAGGDPGRGRRLAADIITKFPGPGANPATMSALWGF